jgi:hypothetical protein
MEIFIAFALGLFAGLVSKGLTININHKDEPKQEGYNESMAKYLPPEVQNYYKSTNGNNKF